MLNQVTNAANEFIDLIQNDASSAEVTVFARKRLNLPKILKRAKLDDGNEDSLLTQLNSLVINLGQDIIEQIKGCAVTDIVLVRESKNFNMFRLRLKKPNGDEIEAAVETDKDGGITEISVAGMCVIQLATSRVKTGTGSTKKPK